MKILKFIAFLILISIFFVGCQKDNPPIPLEEDEINVDLKVFKFRFEGVSSNPVFLSYGKMQELPNGTIKISGFESDWTDRTTTNMANGITHWNQEIVIGKNKKTAKIRGKGKLTMIDGEWDFTLRGNIKAKEGYILSPPGLVTPVPCETMIRVHGVGKSGPVTGLVGEWIYTMDYNGSSPYQYNIDGKIHFNYN